MTMTPEQQAYAHEVADWAEAAQQGRLTYDQNDWLQISKRVRRDESGRVPIKKMREGSCNTQACLAGKVAIDKAPEGTTVFEDQLFLPNGTVELVGDFAREQLGLTYDQAITIFYADSPQAAKRLHYVADHPDVEAYEVRAEIL